MNNETYIYIDI